MRRHASGIRPRLATMMVAVAGLATMACGEASEVDVEELEDQLPAEVVPDAPEALEELRCERPIPRQRGVRSTCTAAIRGESVTLTVTQVDEDGAVEVAVDPPLLDVGTVADELAARFTRELDTATTVTCEGDPVAVRTAGVELRCVAADDQGAERDFVLTVRDDQGTIEVAIE